MGCYPLKMQVVVSHGKQYDCCFFHGIMDLRGTTHTHPIYIYILYTLGPRIRILLSQKTGISLCFTHVEQNMLKLASFLVGLIAII